MQPCRKTTQILCSFLVYALVASLIVSPTIRPARASSGPRADRVRGNISPILTLGSPITPTSQQSGRRESEVLVRFRAGVTEVDRANAVASHPGRRRSSLRGESGVEKVELAAGENVDTVAAQLRLHPAVEFAEPNFLIQRDDLPLEGGAAGQLPRAPKAMPFDLNRPSRFDPLAEIGLNGAASEGTVTPPSLPSQSPGRQPNDPRFNEQWALSNTGQSGGQFGSDIGVTTAWQTSTGSPATVIAVIDSGIDFTHPDLTNNKWTNPAPSSSGDLNGWDFIKDGGSITDEQGHGTAIAGLIAAQGDNGTGISGVMWRASLMSLRVLDSSGTGDVADAVEAIDYAASHGAQIINISWGTNGESLILKDAIERAIRRGVIVVCSAGNSGQNVDSTPYYPASFAIPDLIAVASSDNFDQFPAWSNWGQRVTVAAPGVNVVTTQLGGSYWMVTGTSASAPLVSGVAGLLKTLRPWLNGRQVERALSDGARKVASLSGKVSAGGVVNAAGALQALPGSQGQPPWIPTPGYGSGGPGPGGSFSVTPPPVTTQMPGTNLPNLDQVRNSTPPQLQPRQPIQSNLVCADCDPLDGGGGGSYYPAGDPDFSVARDRPEDEIGNPGVNGVDLGSRNFNWSLPLVSLPGRAGMDLNLTLYYNSLVWTRDGSYIKFNADKGNPAVGFRLGLPKVQRRYVNASGGYSYMLLTSSGGRVELRQVGTSHIYESIDGGYTQLDDTTATAPVVKTTDGTRLLFDDVSVNSEFRCTEIKDRNGNKITATYNQTNGHLLTVTDTLGRVITLTYDGTSNLTAISQTWAGSTHNWATFEYGSVWIQPQFASGLFVNGANNNYVTVLNRVNLHDGSSYRFDYHDYFGQVKQINHWAADNHRRSYTSYNLSSGAGQTDCPRFTERRDWAENWNNNAEAVTTYSVAGDNSWTKVTAPGGAVYKEWFATTPAWKKGLTMESRNYASAADAVADTEVVPTWKKKTTIAWTQDDESLTYQKNPRVTETYVYDSDGNRRRVVIDYNVYAAWSLPYQVIEYASDGTTILRITYTDYNLSSTYTSRRIIGLVSAVHVTDVQAGVFMSKTTFDYDTGGEYLVATSAAATQHDATNYGTGFISGRGNLTEVKRWDVTDIYNSAKAISVKRTGYNITGAPVFTRDALNHQTTISYADSFSDGNNSRNTFAYPTTVTDPDSYQSSAQHNFDFGAVTRTQDPKGAVVTLAYEVLAGRLERITQVDGTNTDRYTRYVYNLQGNIVTFSNIQSGAGEAFSVTYFDGAGRINSTGGDLPNSTGGYRGQFTAYDVMGRVSNYTNPAEMNGNWVPVGDDAAGWVLTYQSYDWKGRPWVTTLPDGATRENTYGGCGCAGGEVTTVRDERGRRRKLTKDVLGRLRQVDELNWNQSVYSTTTYTYNVRDQITSSNQAGQSRSFAYDGYGRLSSKTTPEQGTTGFTYFANDSVQTVTDARGATSTFVYNNRDLVTGITYGVPAGVAATANVSFAYDSAGNRTLMTDGLGYVSYVYDTLSQLTSESRYFNGLASYTLSYSYNLAGELTSITNPWNAQVGYSYDKVGRPISVSGSGYAGVSSYINSITYRAFGVKSIGYNNGKTLSLAYDNRMRVKQWYVPNVMRWDYSYDKFNENSGRVTYAKNLDDGTLDRSYDYDHAGRMWASHTGREARWHIGQESYTGADGPYAYNSAYDQWGNITARNGWGVANASYTASYSNNRRVGLTYDASGNVTNDGSQTYTYDATGQQATASANSLSQAYDGDGLRAKKVENGTTTYYLRSSVLGGQVVSELNNSGAWMRGYVYLGGQLVAIQSNWAVSTVHQDPITKSQRITDSSGNLTGTIVDLDPWGGETGRSSNQAFQPHRYTSYERDANGGDDAMMRRYQSSMSRFSQPDPYDGSYNMADPQSLNRYAYTQNDPVNFVDPSGLFLDPALTRGSGNTDALLRLYWSSWWDSVNQGWSGWDSGFGGTGGGGFGGGGSPQNPSPTQPQQPKPGCKQDKSGGDRGDIEDLLGRAGLSGGITIIGSAPGNPEGIIFRIHNRQAFVGTLDTDTRFSHRTLFGGEHASQVGASLTSVLDYRSFTTRRDTLGIDSHGFRRSLQVDVGDETRAGGALGYADLDCDNPAQDVVGGLRHGVPIILRRLGGLFRR